MFKLCRSVNLLCYCILRITIVGSTIEKRQSENNQYVLRNQLMHNFGFSPDDLDKTEEFAQLSEKLPHFVPDFMKLLFAKYRFELFNLSLEIEGKWKHLGSIEMIQSHRLTEIHTWPKAGIHKLIFKDNRLPGSVQPTARELRLNKKLFPRRLLKNANPTVSHVSILTILDYRFHIVKQLTIRNSSFSSDGWISVDISDNINDSILFLKFFRDYRKNKAIFKPQKLRVTPTTEPYPYYANIISFYKYKPQTTTYEEHSLPNIVHNDYNRHSRSKRDLLQYSSNKPEDCQRHPLVVTFREVGWNKWIIAPQKYKAFYCKGNCPYPLSDNFNATNHAIIQLLVHGLKDVSVPKPCCVPYQLTPETLLYLSNEGDALLREFKDMSVSSCSCR